uniref:Glycosyltransferase RgtA/B/C/D-like domain-containing protein n=1 Tax=uncultured Armatimonadetes bacterium TaxID=157466 RepID=A0A6J4HFI3_9BACT|nr:hypothetical protein AVDCRST_MAG63-537 [uncultured Armatimonadetes bacterium]
MADVLVEADSPQLAVPGPAPRRVPDRWIWAALAIMLIGFALRLAGFLSNRSLWLDEAYLALNLMQRDFGELLQPLSYRQAAPVGFLLAADAATLLLGSGEQALRFVPLLAGLASLPLFWLLARRCLPAPEALGALGLFAGLPPLVYYASELKQYSLDVAVALAILLSGQSVLQGDRFRARRYVILALVGAAAVWFSHPAVFVLGGVGAALFLCAKDVRGRRALLIVGALWAACFLANYLLFLRGIRDQGELHSSWQGRFLRWPVSPGAIRQDLELLLQPFTVVLGFAEYGLAALAYAAGLAALFRRDRRLFWLLAAPFFPAFLASLLRLFPFASRPILYTAPLFLLPIAAGLGRLWRSPGFGGRFVSGVFLFLLLHGPAVATVKDFLRPKGREEMRGVLAYVSPRLRPGDTVWVNDRGRIAFRYYVRYRGFGEFTALDPVFGRGIEGTGRKIDRVRQEMHSLAGRRRVWLIFSIPPEGTHDRIDARILALSALGGLGRQLDRREARGCFAYLYDLSGPSAPEPGRAAGR